MFNFFNKSKQTERLWFATDIHCHIFPGIDDGSPSVDRSVELTERMVGWGLERIFASPHVTRGSFENTPATIGAAREALHAALAAAGSDIRPGNSAEYRLDDLFDEQRAAKMLLTLPGDRLLVENPFVQEPLGLGELLFGLQVEGFRPILVHPERYTYYYSHPERYRAIHDSGVQFQVNLLSLSGFYGKEERRMAEWLMGHDLIDFVGTDLHGLRHVESIEAYLGSREYRNDRKMLESKIKNDRI